MLRIVCTINQNTNRIIKLQKFFSTNSKSLVVSIIGPPNAGKSTLFNRLQCKESNKSYQLASDKHKHGKRKVSGRLSTKISTNQRKMVSGGAIVSPIPGTTRDRRECIGRIGNVSFTLFDTAGLDSDRLEQVIAKSKDELTRDMSIQTIKATQESDLICVIFDARIGITRDVTEICKYLRKHSMQNNQVILLANKCEGNRWASNEVAQKRISSWDTSETYSSSNGGSNSILDNLIDANQLGFGDAIPISALHGEGMADIATIIHDLTQKLGANEASKSNSLQKNEKPLQLAILGRQNVGKSTLVNALLNSKRVIVGPLPGLTRDAISIHYKWNNRPVKLVDTAGMRKVSRRIHASIENRELQYNDIEDQAVNDAMRAMKTADVAALVLDAQADYISKQELAICDAVLKEGRALVIAANKMDLIVNKSPHDPLQNLLPQDYADGVRSQLEIKFPFLRKVPIVPMSSLTNENVESFMPVVFRARERWGRVISTSQLNQWLRSILKDYPPPPLNKKVATKIKYVIQTKGRPPTFLLYCNHTNVQQSYLRFLTKHFQDTFEMYGMEVRLALKKSSSSVADQSRTNENPYFNKAKRKIGGRGVGGRESRKKRYLEEIRKYGKPLTKFEKRKQYDRR